jgi:hypothetical protein
MSGASISWDLFAAAAEISTFVHQKWLISKERKRSGKIPNRLEGVTLTNGGRSGGLFFSRNCKNDRREAVITQLQREKREERREKREERREKREERREKREERREKRDGQQAASERDGNGPTDTSKT